MRRWSLLATVMFALLYWTFAGQFSMTEALTMIIPVACASALALAIHRVAERRFAATAPWARLLSHTCASIAKDSLNVGVRLARSLLRRPRCPAGATLTQPFHFGDDSAREATRRALVTLAVSASPDRYVIDISRDDSLVAHSLVGASAEIDPEWPV